MKKDHIIRHAILTLLDQPEAIIADIVEIILIKDFKRETLRYVKRESVKKFYKREFPEYMKYGLLPVMNKMGGIMVHPTI